jgi:hypothetical protein
VIKVFLQNFGILFPLYYSYICIIPPSFSVPSIPRDVNAVALRPDRIKISWETPEKLHGNDTDIFYVIRWMTENSDGTTSQGDEVYQSKTWANHPILSKLHKNQAGNKYYKKNLKAGQNYTFWVS